MDTELFKQKIPTLWHMAHADCWPSIEQDGLLSAQELVKRSGASEEDREQLLQQVRPEQVWLDLPDGKKAVLRDQQPLDPERLAGVLDDMTVPQWLALLNSLVYFFPTRDALVTLREHRNYAAQPVVVLQLRTATLVAEYGSTIRLASINAGYTSGPWAIARRGQSTFRPIARHAKPVKEVAIMHSVPDLAKHLIRAELWTPGAEATQVA